MSVRGKGVPPSENLLRSMANSRSAQIDRDLKTAMLLDSPPVDPNYGFDNPLLGFLAKSTVEVANDKIAKLQHDTITHANTQTYAELLNDFQNNKITSPTAYPKPTPPTNPIVGGTQSHFDRKSDNKITVKGPNTIPEAGSMVQAMDMARDAENERKIAALHKKWADSGPHVITRRMVLEAKLNSGTANTLEKAEWTQGEVWRQLGGQWAEDRNLGRGVEMEPEPNWRMNLSQQEDARKREVKRLMDVQETENNRDMTTVRDIPIVGVVLAAVDKVIPDLPGHTTIIAELWKEFLDIIVEALKVLTGKEWTRENVIMLVKVAIAAFLFVSVVLPTLQTTASLVR